MRPVDWDRLPAGRRIAKQERFLARYLREEVHPFSATEAGRLDGAGLTDGRVGSMADLDRLPPVDAAEVDGLAAVLRPTAAGLARSPDRFRWWWASATGRRAAFVDEEIEPRFRAIHFDDHGPLVVASSAADLDRLADLGRRALGRAGVGRADAVVTLLPARGDLAFWTVALGCRRGGVAAIHLGDAAAGAEVLAYAPSVVAGTAATLRRVAAEEPEVAATVGLVLVLERLAPEDRTDLAGRYPGADVRALWSPPGVRAPWAECGAGRLHTWPDAEVVQLVDDEVVWTPLGWRGTVVLRLRTGVRARVRDEPCPCGATSPQLDLLEPVAVGGDTPGATAEDAQGGDGVVTGEARAHAFFAEDPVADEPAPGDAAAPAPVDPDGADEPLLDLVPADAERPDSASRRHRLAAELASPPGRDGPDPAAEEARLAAVLDADPRVRAWIAEVDPQGGVAVRLAPVVGQRSALEADLPRLGPALGVTRLAVERPSVVRQRLEASGGARVVTGR